MCRKLGPLALSPLLAWASACVDVPTETQASEREGAISEQPAEAPPDGALPPSEAPELAPSVQAAEATTMQAAETTTVPPVLASPDSDLLVAGESAASGTGEAKPLLVDATELARHDGCRVWLDVRWSPVVDEEIEVVYYESTSAPLGTGTTLQPVAGNECQSERPVTVSDAGVTRGASRSDAGASLADPGDAGSVRPDGGDASRAAPEWPSRTDASALAGGPDGWHLFEDTEGLWLVLCPRLCERVRDGGAELRVSLPYAPGSQGAR